MKKRERKKRDETKQPIESGVSESEPSAEVEVLDPEVVVEPDAADIEGLDFEELEPTLEEASESPAPVTSKKDVIPYNAFDVYLSEIRRFKPLSREEEHSVAVKYFQSQDKQAAYRLISSNLWLVVKIARDYERIAKNVLDLVQEGNIGLMEAVKNFDPYRGVRFPSYAVWWIRAYIIRYIMANWRLVKIGTTQAQRKLFFNLKRESDRLEREGITPTPKLLAQKLDVKEGEVIEMSQRLGASDLSVDAPLQEDSDNTLLSVLPNDQMSAEELISRQQLAELLSSGVKEFSDSLNDKDLAILQGRILGDDKLTLQELSDKLGISKERVRQIENRLREKLKSYIKGKAGHEFDEYFDIAADDSK